MEPGERHVRVETAFNEGDVEALVGLYEPEARMVRDDGSVAHGLDAIREVWEAGVALGGRISMTTHYVVDAGDIALLSNEWTIEAEGLSFSSVTAEVARRQADGSWLYLIDNPYSGVSEST